MNTDYNYNYFSTQIITYTLSNTAMRDTQTPDLEKKTGHYKHVITK